MTSELGQYLLILRQTYPSRCDSNIPVMALDDQTMPTQIPLFSLPLELLDQIISPLLRSFSCSGIVKCWLLGTDSYKDELLLTASRSSDILSLRLISRSFNTLITDILSHQKSRSLANFSGTYRVSSPRFMFTNCSRHLLQQGWGKDNDGSLESLVPILTFNSSVRVLELTCSQLQHLDHPEDLFAQFPNLEQVFLDSHRAVRRNEDLLDDSETSIRSRRGLFDNELESVRVVVGAFLAKKLRVVLRWFITHRHKCHAADKFTSVSLP